MFSDQPPQPFALSVADYAAWRNNDTDHCLLDVREDWEREVCALDPSLHIPLQDLSERIGEIPRDRPVVVVCHHGARSAHATAFLRHHGHELAVNLAGGIDAWARNIDTTMQTY